MIHFIPIDNPFDSASFLNSLSLSHYIAVLSLSQMRRPYILDLLLDTVLLVTLSILESQKLLKLLTLSALLLCYFSKKENNCSIPFNKCCLIVD